jgi:GNAT superfamily N-acetyltransferase
MIKPAASVRPATLADVPAILGFIKELAEYERAPNDVVATEADLARDLFGERPCCEAIMGLVRETPDGPDVCRGFALFFHNYSTWRGHKGLYLEDLYVQPEFRGVGLGRALFARVAEIAVERNCPRLEWNVLDWNEPALKFYRALGAEAMNEWTIHRLSGDALRRAAIGS